MFSFRDVEDCEKIRAAIDGCKRAVVIGGGLIGLEVAKGLLSMGKHVTVAHLMNRLMERQLDAVAAAYLKEDLEKGRHGDTPRKKRLWSSPEKTK